MLAELGARALDLSLGCPNRFGHAHTRALRWATPTPLGTYGTDGRRELGAEVFDFVAKPLGSSKVTVAFGFTQLQAQAIEALAISPTGLPIEEASGVRGKRQG